MEKIDYSKKKYAVLWDNTLVEIRSWTECDCCSIEEMEIYFKYLGLRRFFRRKKTAFAHRRDFVFFSESKREAKKKAKSRKKEKRRNYAKR